MTFVSCAKEPYLASSKSAEDAYRECHALTESKDYDEAVQCFELLKSRYGGTNAAFDADLEIGDNYFRKKEYLLAAETYLSFAKLHPTHEKIAYAYYRIGLSYLRESPKAIDRDQQYLDTAIQYLESAMAQGRGEIASLATEKWREARTRIARRNFYIGRFYYRTGEYQSAIPRFKEIVSNYSGLGLDEKALFFIGDSYLHLANKEKAMDILSVFDQHFPDSPYKKKLAGKIGVSP